MIILKQVDKLIFLSVRFCQVPVLNVITQNVHSNNLPINIFFYYNYENDVLPLRT